MFKLTIIAIRYGRTYPDYRKASLLKKMPQILGQFIYYYIFCCIGITLKSQEASPTKDVLSLAMRGTGLNLQIIME